MRRTPAGPDGLHLGAERQGHRRQLAGRIGVGDRAPDRAAIADLEVPDVGDGPRQERYGGHGGVRLGDRLAHHRADADSPVAPLDGVEALDSPEVDDVRVGGEAQGHHRYQALAARQQLGVVAVLDEKVDDVVDPVRVRSNGTGSASRGPPRT